MAVRSVFENVAKCSCSSRARSFVVGMACVSDNGQLFESDRLLANFR